MNAVAEDKVVSAARSRAQRQRLEEKGRDRYGSVLMGLGSADDHVRADHDGVLFDARATSREVEMAYTEFRCFRPISLPCTPRSGQGNKTRRHSDLLVRL